MPAKSSAQRKWVFAVKGKKWAEAHHFDNTGKLPAHVKKSKGKGGHGVAKYKAAMKRMHDRKAAK
jgi:hypothetical protein